MVEWVGGGRTPRCRGALQKRGSFSEPENGLAFRWRGRDLGVYMFWIWALLCAADLRLKGSRGEIVGPSPSRELCGTSTPFVARRAAPSRKME